MTASANLAQELYLRNGVVVSVRPVTPDDEAAIFAFLTDLCEGSRRLRFFTGRSGPPRRGSPRSSR